MPFPSIIDTFYDLNDPGANFLWQDGSVRSAAYDPAVIISAADPNLVHETQHNAVNAALRAIEAKLGVDSSAVTSSIDYLLKSPLSVNPGHLHTGTYQPLDATLTALAAYNTNGFLVQTAADTFVGRTITGTANRISLTNGSGVAGDPVIDIAVTYVGQASITTLGTIATGTWAGSVITLDHGGTGLTSLTKGDLIYANSSTAFGNISAVTTGNVLISQGVAVAPTWGKIDLTGSVSGILPSLNGGTANGFTKFTGPATSEKTFTLPNANDMIACWGIANAFTAANTQTAGSFTFSNNIAAKFGTVGQVYTDGTDQIITSTGLVSIGVPSAGGGTSNLVANQMGLAGSPISSNSVVNVSISSSTIRTALNFILDLIGTGTVLNPLSVVSTDSGTNGAGFTQTSASLSSQCLSDTHTNTTQTGILVDLGISNSLDIVTAGNKVIYGIRIRGSQNGKAGTGTTAGVFQRIALLQDNMVNIAGAPTSQMKLGALFNNPVGIIAGNSFQLDATTTAVGTTLIKYVTASTRVELSVTATDAIYYSTSLISLLLNTDHADATNLSFGTTTGSKIGAATTQKIAFWNTTPIVQPVNTVAIDTLLVNTGLRASGGVANFDTDIKAAVVGKTFYIKEGTDGMMGSVTLTAGVGTVTINGLTTSDRAFVTLTAGGGTLGAEHKAVCTANTLTVTGLTVANATQTLDTSTLNYKIIRPA